MEVQPQAAPPVVAVVVAQQPGPYFDELLTSLAGQDYPNLSVLVIDVATDENLAARVAAHLPAAYVRRLETDPGFGPAANEALRLVEGAGFFCFLHDDVALEPTTIRALVEEAFRSNAGIVGPKLVEWDDPRRLLAVGMGADKAGVLVSLVEPGELDQEQHDAVRDVFVVPSACMLVRVDLFDALDGFDPDIPKYGHALDLCWRAHVVGARVMVNPDTRVRHAETEEQGVARRRPSAIARPPSTAHRAHLLRGSQPDPRPPADRDPHDGDDDLVAPHRTPGSREERARGVVVELRALQQHPAAQPVPRPHPARARQRGAQPADAGSAQVRAAMRRPASEERFAAAAAVGRSVADTLAPGPRRTALMAWVVAVAFLLIGSRQLLAHGVPAIGQLAPLPSSASDLVRTFGAGWRMVGMGTTAAAPTAFALISARRHPGARPHGAAAHAARPAAPPHRSDRHVAAHPAARLGAAAHRFARRVRGDPAAVQRAEQRAPGRPRRLRRHAVGGRQAGARERAGSLRSL